MKILLVGEYDWKGGIWRYTQELYKGLKEKGFDVVPYGVKGAYRRAFVKAFGTSVEGDYDIVHFCYPTAGKIKANGVHITTFHDSMWYSRYFEYQTDTIEPISLKKKIFSYKVRGFLEASSAKYILGKSAKVICDSNVAEEELFDIAKKLKIKNLLEDTYTDPASQVKVIPLGVGEEILKRKVIDESERKGFVYVGAIHFPHKNFLGLYEAYKRYIALGGTEDLNIYTPTSEKVIRNILSPRGISVYPIIGGVSLRIGSNAINIHINKPDEEVISAVAKAKGMVHLSMEEGFGLPILEAQALGTNVITLDEAKIDPIVKKYTLQANDIEDVALGMKHLESKPKINQEAVSYARSFTWKKTVEETIKFYEER